MCIRLFLLVMLMSPAQCWGSDWTLPLDFAENTTAYPAANSLPVITTPGALTTAARIQAGGEYYLANDIYARADGFAIEADNVTIDLRGYKIVYAGEALDRSYGIAIPTHYSRLDYFPRGYVASGGAINTTVKDTVGGGKIVKATNLARYCSGIFSYAEGSTAGLTVQNITIDHSGIDASGIDLLGFGGVISVTGVTTMYGYVRDDSPLINPSLLAYPPDNSSTYYWVSNRHSGFVAGLKLFNSKHTSANITNNNFIDSPQWGIYMNDATHVLSMPTTRDSSFFDNLSTYPFKNIIANNTIHVNVKVTNGYGIGIASDKTNAYGNTVTGYGAGIAIGAYYEYVHNNTVDVTNGANPEYPTRLWAHGIKVEGDGAIYANQCMISQNSVAVTTRGATEYKDQSFWYFPGTPNTYFGGRGEARVLDLSLLGGTWNEVYGNTFRAIDSAPGILDHSMGVRLTGTGGTGDLSNIMLVYGNTIESNYSFYTMDVYINDGFSPPDFSGIFFESNTLTELDINGVSSPRLFNITTNYEDSTLDIKDPISPDGQNNIDSAFYSFGATPSGSFSIKFAERFCGAPTDTLTITSPQLGTIYDGVLGTSDKTIDMVYRSISKAAGGVITDVTPTYSLTFISGGQTYTDADWVTDLVDEYCTSPPGQRYAVRAVTNE